MGDLGHVPDQEQVEQFNNVDILLIPVGGKTTLTGTRAAEVVNLLEPKIVIPMHYKVPGLTVPLETANRFLKEMAVESPEKMETLKITKSELPDQTRIILLEARQ